MGYGGGGADTRWFGFPDLEISGDLVQFLKY